MNIIIAILERFRKKQPPSPPVSTLDSIIHDKWYEPPPHDWYKPKEKKPNDNRNPEHSPK